MLCFIFSVDVQGYTFIWCAGKSIDKTGDYVFKNGVSVELWVQADGHERDIIIIIIIIITLWPVSW